MISDNIIVVGELNIVLRDEHDNIIVSKVVPNLVVTSGKKLIASRLTGTSQPVMSHMSLGTSIIAPNASDVILGAEISSSRQPLSVFGGTVSNNEIMYSATFGAGVGTGAITEAGIFNAFTGGSMLCRTTFTAVNKDALHTLSINWMVAIN